MRNISSTLLQKPLTNNLQGVILFSPMLEIKPKGTKTMKKKVIKNVPIFYASITKPRFKYEDDTLKEYCLDAVVPQRVAEHWVKVFPKNKVHVYTQKEFQDRYHQLPVVKGLETDSGKYAVVKLKTPANYIDKNGSVQNSRPLPVQVVEDGEFPEVLDENIMVGNNSVCDVYFSSFENKYGSFPRLLGVDIRKLEIYETEAEEFGAEEEAPAPKKKAKPAVSEEIPF